MNKFHVAHMSRENGKIFLLKQMCSWWYYNGNLPAQSQEYKN